jgi:aryl-alcohol dehydrogenase-like predicted oxidoreductase
MIPTVRLARSGLETSRLAFGTSRLHYVDGSDRQRLLSAAADLGLTHLDTAPAYGDGLAEREVGAFIQGRRSRVTIATKYGIPPDPVLAALPSLALPLRAARAVARRVGLWRMQRPMLTPAGLRASAEASLRRLRTDTIDILMLHEPASDRVVSAGARHHLRLRPSLRRLLDAARSAVARRPALACRSVI